MGENPRALRRDVDEARDQLGETVEELAYRVTAPKRLAARVRTELASPAGAGAAAAVLVLVGMTLLVRRRG